MGRMKLLVHCCMLIGLIASPCGAADETRFPARVNVDTDGTAAMDFIADFKLDDGTIPQFYKRTNGTSRRGIEVINSSSQFKDVSVWYPGFAVLMPTGEWKLEFLNFATTCVGLAPGETMVIPGSESVKLMVAEDDAAIRLRPYVPSKARVPNVTWTYSHINAPSYAADFEFWIQDIIQRSIDSYVNRMGQHFFGISFEIYWVDLPPNVFARALTTGRRSFAWPTVRDDFLRPGIQDDSDEYEERLYQALPPAPNLRYFWASASTATTSQVMIPVPLEVEWLGSTAGTPMRIEINRNAAFDIFASIKGKPDGGLKDLEATIVHEIGHHFGFRSEAIDADSFLYNFVSVWDVFRMNDDGSTGISSNRFSFEPRELRLGRQALGTLDIVPEGFPFAFRLANDPAADFPNGQPSHWWSYQADEPVYIGIMRATGLPGKKETVNGVYLQPADIKAFDLMGYKIRFSQPPAAVVPPANPLPAQNAVVLGAPLLSWNSVAAASFYNAHLYDLGPAGISEPEFLWGIAYFGGTSTRLPGAVMQPDHHYEWRAVAQIRTVPL